MPLPLQSTLSTVCPRPFLIYIFCTRKSLAHLPTTQNFTFLVVSATLGFVHTIIINLNLTPLHVSSLVTPRHKMPTFVLIHTLKKFVSHHVKFVKTIFPFSSLQNHLSHPQPKTISSWLLPVFTILIHNTPVSPFSTSFQATPSIAPPCIIQTHYPYKLIYLIQPTPIP